MYLSSIKLKNFRCFGESESTVRLNKGLTLLVGENDSGKSAILDAIRIVLGTTDQAWYRVDISDFYGEDINKEIGIVCKFEDLTLSEQAAFLECLSYEEINDKLSAMQSSVLPKIVLYLHWNCKYLTNLTPPRALVNIKAGINGDVQPPTAESKELLRVTYLRALRDAYGDMQSGRSSRLSQIINSIDNLNEGQNEYSAGVSLDSLSLTGIAHLSNKLLANHPKMKQINKDISDILREKMLLKSDNLHSHIQVSGMDASEKKVLLSLLEKLDLAVNKDESSNYGKVGLGTSNVLSMACELLLNKSNQNNSTFLLIEEPEAHIHAQRQLKLIQALQAETERLQCQIILTTHSPLLASIVSLDNIVVVKSGMTYPMSKGHTKLAEEDYSYLERYLDATKANLFFAKSVLIVEGAAEELLLPTIAKLLKRSFTDSGVSLVNVRGIGLSRFARIFQRVDENNLLKVPVACLTDRDVMPDCAPSICIKEEYLNKENWPVKSERRWKVESDFVDEKAKEDYLSKLREKSDGQFVKTFVSDHWTLEYDLAFSGIMDDVIEALVKINYSNDNFGKMLMIIKSKINKQPTQESKASHLYRYFYNGSTSKGEFAQRLATILEEKYSRNPSELEAKLPKYLIDAIKHVTM